MTINQKLKLIRQTKKYTQKAFASVLGVSERGYQKLEYGKHQPTYKVICKFYQKFPQYTLWLITSDISIKQIKPSIKK